MPSNKEKAAMSMMMIKAEPAKNGSKGPKELSVHVKIGKTNIDGTEKMTYKVCAMSEMGMMEKENEALFTDKQQFLDHMATLAGGSMPKGSTEESSDESSGGESEESTDE